MSTAAAIAADIGPHWRAALAAPGAPAADILQAVPDMLEIVPRGVNKVAGLQLLLSHLRLPREALLAVGDGGNDLGMVGFAGVGVAMGNAVGEVKAAAHAVVAGHDEDGIAEAFERFVLRRP